MSSLSVGIRTYAFQNLTSIAPFLLNSVNNTSVISFAIVGDGESCGRALSAWRNPSHPPRVIPEAALYSGCPGSMTSMQGLAFPLLDPGSRFARPG
jgi:hypothetical protein